MRKQDTMSSGLIYQSGTKVGWTSSTGTPPLTSQGTEDAQAKHAELSGCIRREMLVYCQVLP